MVPLDEYRIRRFGHASAVDNRFHHSETTYENAVYIVVGTRGGGG